MAKCTVLIFAAFMLLPLRLNAQDIPPIPEASSGPEGIYSVYGNDWSNMNDANPPLLALKDGSGLLGVYCAESKSRYIGADLDHMVETDSEVTINDAPGDNGIWHKDIPPDTILGSNPFYSLIWFVSFAYATDGKLLGFFIGNSTTNYVGSFSCTTQGVATSADDGHTWNILGQIPTGQIVVPAPAGSGFYWYDIGNWVSFKGTAFTPPGVVAPVANGTGGELFGSKDPDGAPGSWYGWDGTGADGSNIWVPYTLTSPASQFKTLPTLSGDNGPYVSSLIDDSYLAKLNGQPHEYLLSAPVKGVLTGWVSYDCINWSSPFTLMPSINGQYLRLWGQDSDTFGGQDLVEIWQTGHNPPYTSRDMSEAWVHLGPATIPPAPVIRDATGTSRFTPSVRLSFLGHQSLAYSIYRKTVGSPSYDPPALVTSGGLYTDYTDKTVTQGTTYQYYVTGTNSLGTSEKSNVVTVTASQVAPSYTIQDDKTKLYLDATDATAAGGYPVLHPASGTKGQNWIFGTTDEKLYTITSASNGLVLGFNPASHILEVETPDGSNGQLWKIDASEAHYMGARQGILNSVGNKCWWDPSKHDGGTIYADDYHGSEDENNEDILPSSQANGPEITNYSFEVPALARGSAKFAPTLCGWQFTPLQKASVSGYNGSGIAGPRSAWNAPPAPDGKQIAFIEQQGQIKQDILCFPGSYSLSVIAAQKSAVKTVRQRISVLIDGTSVGTIMPTSSMFAKYSVGLFTVSGTKMHTLTFSGVAASGAKTAFIDNVQISAAKSTAG